MYLRIINLNKGAARYRYLKLVESTRVKGKPVQKTILNFGNIEDWPPERVADLIARLTRFFELSPGTGPEDLSVQEARDGAPPLTNGVRDGVPGSAKLNPG